MSAYNYNNFDYSALKVCIDHIIDMGVRESVTDTDG